MTDLNGNNNLESLADKKLISVRSGTSVIDALEIINLLGVQHLAVTNQLGNIIGLLAKNDIVNLHEPQRLTVDIFMSSPVECVHIETSLRSVALRMLEKKVHSLLVVDDLEKAIGIITTDDLLWQLAHILKDERPASDTLKKIINLQNLQNIGGQLAAELASVGI